MDKYHNRKYMGTIRELALQTPPKAFSARIKIGNTTYELAAVRNSGIPAGEVIKDVEIRAYSQYKGQCFLDEIQGVHVKEVRETIEP